MQITSLKINNQPIKPLSQKQSNSVAFGTLADSCDFNLRKEIAIDYMKTFKNGHKDILRKINKLNPQQFEMLQEALAVIKRSADSENPFVIFSKKLQCNAGYQDVAQKTIKTKDGSRVSLEISFDENIIPRMSRTEYFDGKTVSYLKNAAKSVIIEKKFNEEIGIWELENQFEIINNQNGEPFKILHSKRNDKLPQFIETYEYNLKNYDENFDVISAIKNGQIADGKKIASIEFFDNSFLISQELTQNDTTTKRTYFRQTDEYGNILKTDYTYQILDYFGTEILDINRKFEINPDGTTKTIVGDKTYTTSFDDFQKVITITDEKSKSVCLDIRKYQTIMWSQTIYDFLKKMPADLLLQLFNSDVREFYISYLGTNSFIQTCANGIGFKIQLGQLDEETFAHEIGHIVDYSNYDKLLENQEIKDMYNAEWEIFKEDNPEALENDIKYFSQKSPARGINILHRPAKDDGGLREMIAEVNMLTKTYGLDFSTSKRANMLVKYFPNTIALIARELEASTLI